MDSDLGGIIRPGWWGETAETKAPVLMVIRRSRFGVVVAASLLSGCSWFSNTADSVWSSLSGEDTSTSGYPAPAIEEGAGGTGTVVAIPPSGAEANTQPTFSRQPPAVGTGNYAAQPVTPGSPTGTYVGAKVASLRGDLQRLQDSLNRQNGELQQIRQAMSHMSTPAVAACSSRSRGASGKSSRQM